MSKDEVLRDIRKIIDKLNQIENGFPNFEIKQYQDLITDIVAAIPDMFFITDVEGKFLYYFGDDDNFYLSSVQFIGKKIAEIFPNEFSLKVELQITKLLLGRDASPIYYKLENNIYEARIMRLGQSKILFIIRNISRDIKKLLRVVDLDGKKN